MLKKIILILIISISLWGQNECKFPIYFVAHKVTTIIDKKTNKKSIDKKNFYYIGQKNINSKKPYYYNDTNKSVSETYTKETIKVNNFKLESFGIDIPKKLFEYDTHGLFDNGIYANTAIRSFLKKQEYRLQILNVLGACGNSDAAYALYKISEYKEIKDFWLKRAAELNNINAITIQESFNTSSPKVIEAYLKIYKDTKLPKLLRDYALSFLYYKSKSNDYIKKTYPSIKLTLPKDIEASYIVSEYYNMFPKKSLYYDMIMDDTYKVRPKDMIEWYEKKAQYNPKITSYLIKYYSINNHKKAFKFINVERKAKFNIAKKIYNSNTTYQPIVTCQLLSIAKNIDENLNKIKYKYEELISENSLENRIKLYNEIKIPKIPPQFVDIKNKSFEELDKILFNDQDVDLQINESILNKIKNDKENYDKEDYIELNNLYNKLPKTYKKILATITYEILSINKSEINYLDKIKKEKLDSIIFLFELNINSLSRIYKNLYHKNDNYYPNYRPEYNEFSSNIKGLEIKSKKLSDLLSKLDSYTSALALDKLIYKKQKLKAEIDAIKNMKKAIDGEYTKHQIYWLEQALLYVEDNDISESCYDETIFTLAKMYDPIFKDYSSDIKKNLDKSEDYLLKSKKPAENISKYILQFKDYPDLFVKRFEKAYKSLKKYSNLKRIFLKNIKNNIEWMYKYPKIEKYVKIELKDKNTINSVDEDKKIVLNYIKKIQLNDTAFGFYKKYLIQNIKYSYGVSNIKYEKHEKASYFYKKSCIQKGWIPNEFINSNDIPNFYHHSLLEAYKELAIIDSYVLTLNKLISLIPHKDNKTLDDE